MGQQSWRIQFDVRSATQTDVTAHEAQGETEGFVDEASWEACRQRIVDTFARGGKPNLNHCSRRWPPPSSYRDHQWPMSLLRRIWDSLLEFESGRPTQSGSRSTLVEPGRIRVATRLRIGAGRLASGRDMARTCRARWHTQRRQVVRNRGFCGVELRAAWGPDSSAPWPSRSYPPSVRSTVG